MFSAWHQHFEIIVFCRSPFFFSFLKETLDEVGEVGGVMAVEAADVTLGSAATGALFSTSADMLWRRGSLGRGKANDGGGGGGGSGGSAFRGNEVNRRTDDS